jgi:hypothetical protein
MRFFSRVLCGVALAGLAACGTAPDSSGVTIAVNDSVSIGANDLTARVIGDASTFSLNAAVAQKPVAFWFWAPG